MLLQVPNEDLHPLKVGNAQFIEKLKTAFTGLVVLALGSHGLGLLYQLAPGLFVEEAVVDQVAEELILV
jgi:hypothetical protein